MVSKEEMGQIMKILRTAYPRYYKDISKEEMMNAINLWCEMFSDVDLLTLSLAVKSLISHFEYPPTIADIRKEILKHSEKKETIDYWNEAYNMICNGLYMTEDQFEQHSEVCKRYFGSVARLREKSGTENLNLEVEQSLFNKTAEKMKQRKEHDLLLPNKLKNMIDNVSSKFLLE